MPRRASGARSKNSRSVYVGNLVQHHDNLLHLVSRVDNTTGAYVLACKPGLLFPQGLRPAEGEVPTCLRCAVALC